MLNRLKYLLTLTALSLVMPQNGMAQAERKFPYLMLGFDAGYFQPLGAWTAHRYAKGVDLFRGSVAFNGDLELAIPNFGIALRAGYTNLGLGEWEDYATTKGDKIEASASIIHFGVLLRPYLKMSKPHVIKLEFGLMYSMLQGDERFDNRHFEYDFLKSGLGFVAGTGYDRYLNSTTALTFRVGGVIMPTGVRYADGEQHVLSGLPITLGIRFEMDSTPKRKKETTAIKTEPAKTESREHLPRFDPQIIIQTDTMTTTAVRKISENEIAVLDSVHHRPGVIDSVEQEEESPWQSMPVRPPERDTLAEPKITRLRLVFFAFDDFRLDLTSPQLQAQLEQVVSQYRHHPNARVEVKGFTDALGDSTYNVRLSERRAQAVKDELIRRGIPAERIFAAGFGSSHPLKSDESPEGRMMNRRVEVEIIYDK